MGSQILDFRTVHRVVGSERSEIKFSDIRKSDQFTLHDGEGGLEDGGTVYTADTDAYPVPPEGNFAVDVIWADTIRLDTIKYK